MILVISKISLSRLIDGGAAILALTSKNHHIDMIGSVTRSPLVRLILRVWVCSYVIFASLKRADDTRPCAIIIASLPHIPIVELDITPAINRPIWPIEE